MVTHGPFSTSAGASPVPYLTGAFAGTGSFTVSPILGYQSGGLNPDGTPDTTSRQFQAGLSVTGQGAAQNATLFVMTSAISVTRRTSASPRLAGSRGDGAQSGRLVRTGLRRRVFGDADLRAQHCADTEWRARSQAIQSEQCEYKPDHRRRVRAISPSIIPNRSGEPTRSIRSRPRRRRPWRTTIRTLSLNGYVGGVMVTATGGVRARHEFHEALCRHQCRPDSPATSASICQAIRARCWPSSMSGASMRRRTGMTSSSYVFGSLDVDNVSISG